uniref:NADH-ubiquinone oxidoreductase chain 4 n=1 Tax=Ibidoecus plataleae TaxID=3004258 RepID=A0A9E9EPN2_9NEOP|nr:NADH dehydrogenase subunit 4 [Ibidoecus plataleae]
MEYLMFVLPVICMMSSDAFLVMISLITLLTYFDWGSEQLTPFFFKDELSLLMMVMSLFVLVPLVILSWGERVKTVIIALSMVLTLWIFSCDSILLFFILFEFSLVPMVMLVYFQGKNPERLAAGVWMFMLTLVSSVGLLIVVSLLVSNLKIDSMSMINCTGFTYEPLSNTWFWLASLSFLVKIPAFGFHTWLPKAHVEASLEGSLLLAGIMLKMGGYGLVRLVHSNMSFFKGPLGSLMTAIFTLGSIISVCLMISSDDMKVIVAYSSVSHMNIILVGIVTMKMIALKSVLIIMFCHSFTSCMMFYLVNEVYEKSGTRSLVSNYGFFSAFKGYVFFSWMIWMANMSLPPFLSFMGEMLVSISVASYSMVIFVALLMFILLTSVGGSLMYCSWTHGTAKIHIKMSDFGMKFYQFCSLSIVVMISLFVFSDALL